MKTRSSGFTLAEVLVSIVIGVISIAAAFASYNYFNKCASSGHIEEERHRAPERELKFMHACML